MVAEIAPVGASVCLRQSVAAGVTKCENTTHHVDVENFDAKAVIVLVHHSHSFIVYEDRTSILCDSSPGDYVSHCVEQIIIHGISYHPPPEPPWNSMIANGVDGL